MAKGKKSSSNSKTPAVITPASKKSLNNYKARRAQANNSLIQDAKLDKECPSTTKGIREFFQNSHNITKARANDLAKQVIR